MKEKDSDSDSNLHKKDLKEIKRIKKANQKKTIIMKQKNEMKQI